MPVTAAKEKQKARRSLRVAGCVVLRAVVTPTDGKASAGVIDSCVYALEWRDCTYFPALSSAVRRKVKKREHRSAHLNPNSLVLFYSVRFRLGKRIYAKFFPKRVLPVIRAGPYIESSPR